MTAPVPQWVKSSFCNADGCVEVARVGDKVAFGLSGDGNVSERLRATRVEWEMFKAGVKAGDFDDV